MQIANPHQALGVASLVGQSFALLFRRFDVFAPIAFIPSILVALIQTAALPDPSMVMSEDGIGAVGPLLVTIALSLLVGLLVMCAVTLAAYDVRMGRPVRPGLYIARTVYAAVPIVVLGLLAYVAAVVGFLFLIVPGLYVLARYWVMTPVVLIERAGFGGLSRAAELTRGYRWPILGAVLCLILLLVLLSIAVTLGLSLAVDATLNSLSNQARYFPGVLLESVSTALQYAVFSIFTALLYARLRQIKEGLGMEELTAVFE